MILHILLVSFFCCHILVVLEREDRADALRISFLRMRFGQNEAVNKSSGYGSFLIIRIIILIMRFTAKG